MFIEKIYIGEKNNIEEKLTFKDCVVQMAEGVGLEPTQPYGIPVFKTGPLPIRTSLRSNCGNNYTGFMFFLQ